VDGSLNDILPEPISPANEEVVLDLLRRKMMVSLDLAVDVLHAMESRFGPEAREVIREMAEEEEFEAREDVGDPDEDLREFCALAEAMAAGSHRWQRVTDEPTEIGFLSKNDLGRLLDKIHGALSSMACLSSSRPSATRAAARKRRKCSTARGCSRSPPAVTSTRTMTTRSCWGVPASAP